MIYRRKTLFAMITAVFLSFTVQKTATITASITNVTVS